ncbi:hypothetical protein A2U01_0093420, partial [Trifolium medium]|nr:hypothetical protein [Trifolium medium]
SGHDIDQQQPLDDHAAVLVPEAQVDPAPSHPTNWKGTWR